MVYFSRVYGNIAVADGTMKMSALVMSAVQVHNN